MAGVAGRYRALSAIENPTPSQRKMLAKVSKQMSADGSRKNPNKAKKSEDGRRFYKNGKILSNFHYWCKKHGVVDDVMLSTYPYKNKKDFYRHMENPRDISVGEVDVIAYLTNKEPADVMQQALMSSMDEKVKATRLQAQINAVKGL